MRNKVCEVLNIEKPVIQGPMAWVSTAPLVSAVSNAGGLGVLGVGFAPLQFVREQIEETKKLTDKPFAINTIIEPEMCEHISEIIEEMRPPVVYADTLANLDEELCKKYFSKWKEAGSKVIVKASFMSDAIIADNAGADIIIVKGWEGGGHTTYEATTVLVPQAKDIIKAPIIASGGIADGRGVAAAIALGADGIEMGTIFMASKEALIHPNVKSAIIEAGDMSTVITGYSTDEPCRQLKNKLSKTLISIEDNNSKAIASKQMKDVAESSLKKAMMDGDLENGAVMAGQIVPLITEIKTVKDIIETVLSQGRKRLEEMKKICI